MAEVKVLAKEDWGILEQAPDKLVPDPNFVVAAVATEGQELNGRSFLVLMPHIEATWVADAIKGTLTGARIVKRLEEAIVAQARTLGIGKIMSYCPAENECYMERLGYTRAPYSVWEKEL